MHEQRSVAPSLASLPPPLQHCEYADRVVETEPRCRPAAEPWLRRLLRRSAAETTYLDAHSRSATQNSRRFHRIRGRTQQEDAEARPPGWILPPLPTA